MEDEFIVVNEIEINGEIIKQEIMECDYNKINYYNKDNELINQKSEEMDYVEAETNDDKNLQKLLTSFDLPNLFTTLRGKCSLCLPLLYTHNCKRYKPKCVGWFSLNEYTMKKER